MNVCAHCLAMECNPLYFCLVPSVSNVLYTLPDAVKCTLLCTDMFWLLYEEPKLGKHHLWCVSVYWLLRDASFSRSASVLHQVAITHAMRCYCITYSILHKEISSNLPNYLLSRSTELDSNWSWFQLRCMQVGGNACAVSVFSLYIQTLYSFRMQESDWPQLLVYIKCL